MLDNTRLRSELAHIHRTLSGVAAAARGKALVDDLRREIGGTTAALLWQSLFADCLRVVHGAVAADGVIGDDEIEAVYEFVFSAARHYAGVLVSSYGEFSAVDEESARAFLDRYAIDRGAFGRAAAQHWPGLTLCRRAAEIGEPEALERYERMMSWLITAACQVGGVTDADPRWRGRVDELDDLRRTLARTMVVENPDIDLRLQAFLSPTRIFASVEQVAAVFEADPFDVETIHEQARTSFEQLVDRATTPSRHVNRGRMLLLLGDSGSGKTHLLRGFRRHVQEYGRGFVVYAQLHSSSDDYARYLLQHVVDSLARPYAGPSGERTGLHELASGLPRLVGGALQARVNRLADDDWGTNDSLSEYIDHLIDDLLDQAELASFDPDLLRVLLYALHPSQRTISRIYKYLRCENMNAHDRRSIGDVVPRTDKGDPEWMIRQLARLAFVTQHAATVLMVDQAELAGFEESSILAFRRAVDTLNGIISEVPSAVAVVACLSDLYYRARGQLTKSAVDRLENDPPLEKLDLNRSYAEIEALVGRRLSWLFAEAGAVYRSETPVYPIPEAKLSRFSGHRTREVLEWCHRFQQQCAAAGRIVDVEDQPALAEAVPTTPVADDLDQIATAWNDAAHAANVDIPDSDEEILAVVGAAARACADETGLALTTQPPKDELLRLTLSGPVETDELVIAVTNRGYQRGAFGKDLEALRKAAGTAVPIAVRTIEFPRGEACENAIAKLLKTGGRRAYVDASTLRVLVALQRFRPPFPEARIAAWRRRDRPISILPPMALLFDLERLRRAPDDSTAAAAPTSTRPAAATPVPPASIAIDPRALAAFAPQAAAPQPPPELAAHGWPGAAASPARPATMVADASSGLSQETQGPGQTSPARSPSAARLRAGTFDRPAATTASAAPAGASSDLAAVAVNGTAALHPAPPRTATGTGSPSRIPSGATPRMGYGLSPASVPAAGTLVDALAATVFSARPHLEAAVSPVAQRPATVTAAVSEPSPAVRAASAVPTTTTLRVGTASNGSSVDRTIELSSLLRHTGILGSPGSGKTTLALNLIEQVLERDVAVVLIDRKGDLAGYANPDWWQTTSDRDRARRLAERMEVRLFTPGTRGGRPLSLSLVPDLEHIAEHERDRMVQ
jgi:Ni2+-binding GTPase involved in maturation of urease and hydrogenase